MQLVLIVVGVKAYLRLPRLPRTGLRVLASPAYGFLLFTLFMFFHSPVPAYITDNEYKAMSSLEALASDASFDPVQAEKVFPGVLGKLGPNYRCPCTAEMNPPQDGYVIEFHGTQPSSTFQGCTRFKAFIITARPVTFGKTGIRSFLIDSSGLGIHFTSENRPARTTDPKDYVRHEPQ